MPAITFGSVSEYNRWYNQHKHGIDVTDMKQTFGGRIKVTYLNKGLVGRKSKASRRKHVVLHHRFGGD